MPQNYNNFTVGIIGGGVAGMAAASLLEKQLVDYSILEATPNLGGRVKSLTNFADNHIELGAEFIHGHRSTFYQMAVQQNCNLININHLPEGKFWLDNQLQWEKHVTQDPDIQQIFNLLKAIKHYRGPDISVEAYSKQHPEKFPPRSRGLLEAFTANPYGTSLGRLGMAGWAEEEKGWQAGDTNHIIADKKILDIIKTGFGNGLKNSNVILECAVHAVDYTSDKVIVTDRQGNKHIFDNVIVTIPLTMLKNQSIHFKPALPEEKQTAIHKLGMDAGMKVILKFQAPFWSEDCGSIQGGGIAPAYWTPYGTRNILSAFIMGEQADRLRQHPGSITNRLLSELDEMTGNNNASGNFKHAYIQDWTEEPFIQGAYSYPAPGSRGFRKKLAEPVNDKLFFAGEATHTKGHNSTVHGAIETAERVVNEVLAANIKNDDKII